MALTTLTAAPSFDAVRAPNNGTKVVAVSASDPPPNDEGPLRPALQALVNRDEFNRVESAAIEAGARTFAALKIDGVGGQSVALTAGTFYVSGTTQMVGNVEIGGTLEVIGTSASVRKLLIVNDSGGTAVPYGTVTRDLTPFGAAGVASDGTLIFHANIAAHPVSPKPATGRYKFVLQTCPPSCTGLGDGSVAPVSLQATINDAAEVGRGDSYLYRPNAWATKQTIAGSPVVVIEVAITAQGISAGSLTKSLSDIGFSLSVWA